MFKDKKILSDDQIIELKDKYIVDINSDLEFSLKVDPENKYNMSEKQKQFIEAYCKLKDPIKAASMVGINQTLANNYFNSYATQTEIRRICRAFYHHQFSKKLLSLDEVGGFLSSLITDENIPLCDRLSTKDKLQVIKMIIDLNVLKNQLIQVPTSLSTDVLEKELKNLSVNSIKNLLSDESNKKINNEKTEVINKINENNSLSPEEIMALKSLTLDELISLLNEINKK